MINVKHLLGLIAIFVLSQAAHDNSAYINEYVRISRIRDGTLVGNKSGLPAPAKGYFMLGRGMHTKSGADVAIVDGAVLFVI
jgi:hypothetical protein